MKIKVKDGVVSSLLTMQLITTAIASALMYAIYGMPEAISASLGGLTALLPTAIFARKMFRFRGARAARQIVRSFYIGEALKICVSIILFASVFMYYRVKAPPFFLTYIAVVMNYWFIPLFFTNKHDRPESD